MVRKERFSFIVIEGIDGVGKTTCVPLLAEKIQAACYKIPSGLFKRTRAEIDASADVQVRFSFYLTSVFHASIEIGKLLLSQNVVCDRYIFSTIAYHLALGADLFYLNIAKLPILWPDYSFYLCAREEVRRRRMALRPGLSPSDVVLERDIELQRRVHQEFLKFPLTIIDNSDLNPDEVCKQILDLL